MLKIGLTGGIASGKSKVAQYFAALNIDVIDTDAIARELTQPNTYAYNKILKHFDTRVQNKQGELDRRALRRIIAKEPKARAWLEKLLHPLILKKMQAKIKDVTSVYCILMIPLLLETKVKGFRSSVDRILVVETPKKEQIQRIMRRDKVSLIDAKAILNAQIDRAKRLKATDDIIFNKGSLKELRKKVLKLHKKYSLLSQSTPGLS